MASDNCHYNLPRQKKWWFHPIITVVAGTIVACVRVITVVPAITECVRSVQGRQLKKIGSLRRLLLLRDAWIIRECVWSLYLNLNLNVIFQTEVQYLNIKLFSCLTCWFAALHRSLAPEINHYYLRQCKISYLFDNEDAYFAGQDSKALQRF